MQDLDSSTGADDLFIDRDSRNAYLITGSDHVDVYRWNAGKLGAEGTVVQTAVGAKPGLLVPAIHTLYVGIPPTASAPASIRDFSTEDIRQ